MHDQTIAVGHQHPFEGAVEHRRGHAQTLAILAAQLSTDADEIEQAGTGDEDQPGGEQYPDERIDLPRDRQHLGIIESPCNTCSDTTIQSNENTKYSAAMRKASRTETDMSGG